MTARRLIIWLLFLAVAVSLYFLSEVVDQRAEQAEAERNRLVSLSDPLNVQSLELSGTSLPKPIRIQRRDQEQGWEMVSPLRYPADGLAVGRLLSAVVEGHIQKRIENPGDWKQFGLQPPAVKLTLRDRSGGEAVLLFGELSPNKQFAYAAPPGSKQVWMVTPAVRDAVNRSRFDLRDKAVLELVVNKTDRLELSSGPKPLQLKRVRGGAEPLWQFADGTEADSEAVEDVLFKVNALRTLEFIDQGIDLKRMGLAQPSGRVVIGLQGGGQKGLALGGPVKGREETYLRRLAGGPVMVVKTKSLDFLRKVSRFQLSQRHLLRYDRDQVVALSVQRGGQVLKYAKQEDGWVRTQPPGDKKSGYSVSMLAWDLAELKWQQILGQNSILGLDKPQAVITLTLQAPGKDQAGARTSKVLKLGQVDKASGLLAAKVSGDDRVFGIKPELLKGLPQVPPAQDKASKKQK